MAAADAPRAPAWRRWATSRTRWPALDPLARVGICGTRVPRGVRVLARAARAPGAGRRSAERDAAPGRRRGPAGRRRARTRSTPPTATAWRRCSGPAAARLHLAEDPAERLFCRDGTGRFRRLHEALGGLDIDALRVRGRSAGGGGRRPSSPPVTLAVHCVDLDPEDLALLAASGATAVLCPRSNRHISGLRPAAPGAARGRRPARRRHRLAGLLALAVAARGAGPAAPRVPRRARPRGSSRSPGTARRSGAPHVGRLAPGPAPGVLAAPLGGAQPGGPLRVPARPRERRGAPARLGRGQRPGGRMREPSAGAVPLALARGLALARMVKLSHSLFALPFAAAAVALVALGQRPLARPSWACARAASLLVALAVVAARTAAMSMNRIADRAIDARNPRTARRELVTGEVSPRRGLGPPRRQRGRRSRRRPSASPWPAACSRRRCWRCSSATPSPSASPGPATSGWASPRRWPRWASPWP